MERLRPLAAAFALFGLSCCQPAQDGRPATIAAAIPATPPAEVGGVPVGGSGHPALWKLSDDDTTIWLFGTIHVLPAGFVWRNPAIDEALAGSRGLILETVLGDDPAATSQLLLSMGAGRNEPPLVDRIAPAKKQALAAMIARSGMPAAFLDSLETWTASLMLMQVTLHDLKLDPANGVEEQLVAQFRAAGKPVEGLETPAEQLGFFDTLPESAQRVFLATLPDPPEESRRDFDAMLDAWSRGDGPAIVRTFDEDMGESPELRDALLKRRNENWAVLLEKRLEAPGTLFVAVGAGHLAGAHALTKMLAAKGLKVERVQ